MLHISRAFHTSVVFPRLKPFTGIPRLALVTRFLALVIRYIVRFPRLALVRSLIRVLISLLFTEPHYSVCR